jgi:hypothetical protein
MYKLYYTDKIYNFVFCVGEGVDEEKSINQSRNLILRYLRNNKDDADIQTIAFEEELKLQLSMDSVAYEDDECSFIFGKDIKIEEENIIDTTLINKIKSNNKEDKFKDLLQTYNFDITVIRYPLSPEEYDELSYVNRPRAHSI